MDSTPQIIRNGVITTIASMPLVRRKSQKIPWLSVLTVGVSNASALGSQEVAENTLAVRADGGGQQRFAESIAKPAKHSRSVHGKNKKHPASDNSGGHFLALSDLTFLASLTQTLGRSLLGLLRCGFVSHLACYLYANMKNWSNQSVSRTTNEFSTSNDKPMPTTTRKGIDAMRIFISGITRAMTPIITASSKNPAKSGAANFNNTAKTI